MCISLSLLRNSSVKTSPRQRRIVGGVVFYAIRVVSKESRRLVLPRTSTSFKGATHGTRSRDSSVGIATGYGLDDQGEREFESRLGKKCSLLHIVQTGSGVNPTSYKMGTGGSFPGVKRHGRAADHSPPTSAEVKKMWIYTSTPPYVFMA
jgi:hypothetical protein